MADFGGRYRRVRSLGGGAMGEVWLAADEELGDRLVAVKVMRPEILSDAEGLAWFRREMLLACRMQHPNVITVFSSGTENGVPFMVMEYLRGHDLRKVPVGWGVEEIARAGREVCLALAYAHGLGVVHRDIKPSNLFVCDTGLVKVTDFGLAKALTPSKVAEPGTQAGTPPYMAPEQWLGEPVTFAIDIWAAGCTLYELLSGKRARDYPTWGEYLAAATRGDRVAPLPSDAQVPSWLADAVMAMLEPDPTRRPSADGCAQLLSGPHPVEISATGVPGPPPAAIQRAPLERLIPTSARVPTPQGSNNSARTADAGSTKTGTWPRPSQLNAARGSTPRRDPGRRQRPRKTSAIWSAGGAAVVLAAAVVAVVLLHKAPPESPGHTSHASSHPAVSQTASSPAASAASSRPGYGDVIASRVLAGASYGFKRPGAIASDGTRIWVADFGGNSVTELNAKDGALIQTLTGASYGFNDPVAIAFDGTHIWVANLAGNSVTELIASDGSLIQTLTGASYGFYGPVRLASDGTHIWVANVNSESTNGGGNSVTELNASDGALIQTLTGASYGFSHPVGIAFDGTHIWVANSYGNSVTELNASDGSLIRTLTGASYGFNFPLGIVSDGTHIWVTNDQGAPGGDSVTELNASDGSLIRLLKGARYGFSNPVAIAFDGTHIWVTNGTGNSVTELTLE